MNCVQVALLLALETIHVALSIWLIDYYLVENYGNIQVLQSATWLTTATFVTGFLIDLLVYFYFMWRIWIFAEKLWIVVFMGFIGISRSAIGIAAAFLSVFRPTWVSYLVNDKDLILISNSLFIVGDVFSAAIMAFHLNKSRESILSSARTDTLLNRLLTFAVAAGSLTVLVDIIALIFTLAEPVSLGFTGPVLIQTRLYANSLLASLNLRKTNAQAFENAVELSTLPIQFAHQNEPSEVSTETGRGTFSRKVRSAR
ncbi:hypothetical protein SCLCIDRAFT_1212198 [Scleroderma citrinum Foug A]|uniref:DUF6534 domain-containing protein n=1 Tax=Scleroderma citrinum Foug A TaxID=1036808 RepID=A0A0C3EAV7_9AGAM|nr:hypothetical protein SCLCIDRAFT_1212198 [Scleroderma citrinum Foug A]